jgi:hypothetical protein
MNSAGYSGTLAINDTFYNLSTIDISKSRISLNINGSRITNIDARNINSSSLVLTNCNNLQNVQLAGAAITSCDIRPAWIKNIDLSNNKIKSLSIAGKLEDESYGSLTIANNSTITDINFSKFSTVSITNCSALKSVVHSDNPSVLTSLVINNCTALTSLTVYIDQLNTLNLSGCRTKVKYITYDTGTDQTCLDISRFTNLGTTTNSSTTYFRIGENSEVEEIQFKNEQNSSVYLIYNLQGCTKLRRVYGNIRINATSCFYNLRNFSIHGADLSTVNWHGISVLNSTTVKHPKDITTDYFSSGNKVTNITFNLANASYAFYQTNCTLFDYYYMLSNLGSGTNIADMFEFAQNTSYGLFDIETGNNPDTRLFTDCNNVTSIRGCFRRSGSTKRLYLKSPTVSSDTVTSDNGLFSPLINCTDFSTVFLGYYYVIDKYLFRRAVGNYKVTTINYFYPAYILNEPPVDFS